jgi:hypothetical protein
MNALSKTIVLACCVIGLRVSATLTGYSDLASWDAAVSPSSITSINFEGIVAPGGFTAYSSPPGVTVGGVNFQYTDPNPGVLFVLGDGFYGSSAATLSPQDFSANASRNYEDGITVTLPSPVTALSTTIGSFYPGSSPFIFVINGSSYTATSGSTAAPTFVGITSDTPFTSFTVTDPNDYAMTFANFNFAPSLAPVPEPTTIISGAMLLLPFGSSAFRQLRKKFQAA